MWPLTDWEFLGDADNNGGSAAAPMETIIRTLLWSMLAWPGDLVFHRTPNSYLSSLQDHRRPGPLVPAPWGGMTRLSAYAMSRSSGWTQNDVGMVFRLGPVVE